MAAGSVATTLGRDVQVVGGIARVTGVAGVLALVLAETIAGAAALTWISPLWNETKRSYFTLWSVLATLLFAWPAWFAASSSAIAGDATGGWATRLALVAALLGTVTAVAFLVRQPTVGRVVGIVSVPVSLAVLAVMAATGRQGYPVSLFQLVAGAEYQSARGLSFSVAVGYARLLQENLSVSSGSPSEADLSSVRRRTGSGPVASISLGHAF